MVLKAGVADEDGYSKEAIGIVLVAINCAVIGLAVTQILLVFWGVRVTWTGVARGAQRRRDTDPGKRIGDKAELEAVIAQLRRQNLSLKRTVEELRKVDLQQRPPANVVVL